MGTENFGSLQRLGSFHSGEDEGPAKKNGGASDEMTWWSEGFRSIQEPENFGSLEGALERGVGAEHPQDRDEEEEGCEPQESGGVGRP